MQKIIKNFIYQSIFQVVKIIIPVVTIPIVSKAIGPQGIGIYNYTNSIVQYFVLFAGLGINIYGNREIALAKIKGELELSKTFWEIFLYKTVLSAFSIILFLTVVSFSKQRIYLYAQVFVLVGTLIDISWFFMGIEDFKKTSLANLVIQMSTLFLIVLLVNDSSDILTYILIQSLGLFLSQIIIWFFVKKYIKIVRIKLRDSLEHAKGAFNFFIPQVSIILYTNVNKTILGFFLGTAAVGYFSNSLQINSVLVTVITTIDIVLLPYMSGLFAKNNIKKIINTMKKTIHLQLFFSIPLMFGMLTIFDKLVPWFFGEKFLFINSVIPLFTPLIVIIPLGMAISRQYLLPVGKIGEYNKSVLIGAIINIILNIILLPTIGFYGVVISTIIAELFVTLVRTISFVQSTEFVFNWNKIFYFFLSGIIMCIVTRYLTRNMEANIVTTIIQTILGMTVYFSIVTMLGYNELWQFKIKK